MGDEKYMERVVVTNRGNLTITQAVQAAVASFRDKLKEILGSEPFVDNKTGTEEFTLATYGAGEYRELSRFSISRLYGCCGVAVFYHASVAKDFRSRGLGTLLLQLREEAARKAGYSLAVATVQADNEEENMILRKAQWELARGFKNIRTGNDIVLYTKELTAL